MPHNWIPVDHTLVHKHARAEALAVACASTGHDEWVVQVEVPRSYSVIDPVSQQVPAVVAVEIVRQAGLVVSHLGYGIPLGWAFTIQEVEARWDGGLPRFDGHAPFQMDVAITVRNVGARKGKVSGMEMLVDLGGHGGGRAVHRVLAPHEYRVMRRNAPAKGSVPPRLDDQLLRDCRRSEGRLEALLGWNEPANPFVFDHPVDHIPGMLFAQASIAAHERLSGRPALGVVMNCERFAELGQEVTVVAESAGLGSLALFTQRGESVARVLVDA